MIQCKCGGELDLLASIYDKYGATEIFQCQTCKEIINQNSEFDKVSINNQRGEIINGNLYI